MVARIGAAALARRLGDSWRAGSPAYEALASGVRGLVLDGRLPLDVRLPSERELGAALGLSRTTITAAYARLRETGFLVSRQGAGSWTATPEGAAPSSMAIQPVDDGSLPADTVDLSIAALPAAGQALRTAYERALQRLPRHLPGPGYAVAGLPEAREAVARWFVARGLPTSPDQIVVTSGALNALATVLRAVVAPGDRVVVEHPTYPNALDGIRRAGARIVPVGVGGRDEPAWDIGTLVATFRQAAPTVAYVMPDHHNPTGASLDAAGRGALAAVAASTQTVLVVDETMVELPIDAPPQPPVGSLAADVVTVGGVSKSHWGGLRLGWLRGPRSLVARLVDARLSSDLGTPLLEQLALVELLEDPAYGDHLAARRAEVRRRRDALELALRRHLPQWHWRRPGGGMSLWAELDRPVSTMMAALAGSHGLRLTAGPRFGLDGAFERFLRLPLTVEPARAGVAASRLARLADEAARGARSDWWAAPVA